MSLFLMLLALALPPVPQSVPVNAWKIDASPASANFGQSVTFALYGPPGIHVTCQIRFGDEGMLIRGVTGSSIDANGTAMHTYKTFGVFQVEVSTPCHVRTTVTVNAPVPTPPQDPSGWTLATMPASPAAGDDVLFVLFAPSNKPLDCRIRFGDEPRGQILGGATILPNGIQHHNYGAFGKFNVEVGSPCHGRLQLSVSGGVASNPSSSTGVWKLGASPASSSSSGFRVEASPASLNLGHSTTLTLFGPTGSHIKCAIQFGDEDTLNRLGVTHSTIEANGTLAHVYQTFGTFVVQVLQPCKTSATVAVNAPVPTPPLDAAGWALVASPSPAVASQPVTFVLFGPAHTALRCGLYFGDEQPPILRAGGTIIANSTQTHTYDTFGTFNVKAESPCHGTLRLTVKAPA